MRIWDLKINPKEFEYSFLLKAIIAAPPGHIEPLMGMAGDLHGHKKITDQQIDILVKVAEIVEQQWKNTCPGVWTVENPESQRSEYQKAYAEVLILDLLGLPLLKVQPEGRCITYGDYYENLGVIAAYKFLGKEVPDGSKKYYKLEKPLTVLWGNSNTLLEPVLEYKIEVEQIDDIYYLTTSKVKKGGYKFHAVAMNREKFEAAVADGTLVEVPDKKKKK